MASALQQFAVRTSVQLRLAHESHEAALREYLALDRAAGTLTETRAVTTRAIHKAFAGHVFGMVAARPLSEWKPIRGTAVPAYLFVRASSSEEWSVRSFRQFWLRHCQGEGDSHARFDVTLSAADLGHIGSVLTLPYAGVWSRCHGDVASFLPVPAALPHSGPLAIPKLQTNTSPQTV